MTIIQYSVVFGLAIGSWLGMALAMRKYRRPNLVSVMIILLCLAGMIGAFSLGTKWQNIDLTCHPGQHCFPWGD